jgi:uncharacterized membrane protein YqjE
VAECLSLLGSLGRYFQSLGALAGEEAREAAALGARLLVMGIAALFFAGLGYIFLVLAIALLAAQILGIPWLWILGAFTLLHLLVAWLCAGHVRRHSRTPLFESTRREISSDLSSLGKNSKP